jgi:hypothetical protein
LYDKFRGLLYPFKLSYWRGHTRTNVHPVDRVINASNQDVASSVAFEDEPTDKELGVQLNNVSKVNK